MSVASLVSEKYDDQIRSAANMESQSAAASDLTGCNESKKDTFFYDIDTDKCVTDLRFSRHI